MADDNENTVHLSLCAPDLFAPDRVSPVHSLFLGRTHHPRPSSRPTEGSTNDRYGLAGSTRPIWAGLDYLQGPGQASIRFYRDAIGLAVAQTFENEGKVVAAVVAAGDCHIVLNQDDGKLGWDRIKGQGFDPADQRGGRCQCRLLRGSRPRVERC